MVAQKEGKECTKRRRGREIADHSPDGGTDLGPSDEIQHCSAVWENRGRYTDRAARHEMQGMPRFAGLVQEERCRNAKKATSDFKNSWIHQAGSPGQYDKIT